VGGSGLARLRSVHQADDLLSGSSSKQGRTMSLFSRNPVRKLEKAYQRKMEAAMHAMRRGDIRENANLVAEADKIRAEMESARLKAG
jgi:hypothetical protein